MALENPIISVIMPSFNVGDYIEECIKSVVNQSLHDLEIICIDAGSTDGTLEILEKYAKADLRVRLISSDKKSYGYQVNLGLNEAKGEYIAIVETDDFIKEDMFETLYNLSEDSKIDIIKGNFFHFHDSDIQNPILKKDTFKSSILRTESFKLEEEVRFLEGHPSIWAGIYNRSFLEKFNIRFKEEPGGGWVDNPFFYETAICARSIKYTDEAFYYYRESNPNSSSNSLNDYTIPMKRVLDMFEILEKHDCKNEGILVSFYNRLFRYIEIILENNNNTDKDLTYDACFYIHEVVKKLDENIVKTKMKFNFQKLYYKYVSPLFMSRFEGKLNISDEDYDKLVEENEFLHSQLTFFRTQYNEVNYEKNQLEKQLNSKERMKKHEDLIEPKYINLVPEEDKISGFDLKMDDSESDSKNYKISVIMPVYNGEKFLKRSVESILKQTLDDIEIVFINDGSTDNSLEILKDFKNKYDFVTVLTQNNLGSGKARNYGIKEAKGEYIAFLDADDFFMDNDALEKMYDVASKNDANMVTANITHDVDKEGDFKPFGPFHYYKSNDVILPEAYGIPWSFYKNIFKKDFLVSNEIFFPDLLRGQDPVFLAEVLVKVDKIFAVATDLYAYVYNSDVAKASNYRKLYDQLLHYKMVFDYFEDSRFSRRQREYFHKIFLFIGRLDLENSKMALDCVRDIFKDHPSFLKRLENHLYLKYNELDEFKEHLKYNPIISVIIPFSDDDATILKSVNSVLNQSIKDIEILLINMDSSDDSLYLMENLSYNDSRIKILYSDCRDKGYANNLGLKEANGEYVYFFKPNAILKDNALRFFLENSVMNGSEITFCNCPGNLDNGEINFDNIFRNVNYNYHSFNYEDIDRIIFNSSFDSLYKVYKREFLTDDLRFLEDVLECESSFHIKTILNSVKLSFIPKFLFEYINPRKYSALNFYLNQVDSKVCTVFDVCDDIEGFLKENDLYENFKVNFDIYKINQITSYLGLVRFIGSYTYNNPKERDLFKNNAKVLDYANYYGSKSDYLGLDYSFAEKYFNKAKQEFDELDYRDMKFADLNKHDYSIWDNLYKYQSVLKSNSFKEYLKLSNFAAVAKLRNKNDILMEENRKLLKQENEQVSEFSKSDLEALKAKKQSLKAENDNLRKEYWKYRNLYDDILNSTAWKSTESLRKLKQSFRK